MLNGDTNLMQILPPYPMPTHKVILRGSVPQEWEVRIRAPNWTFTEIKLFSQIRFFCLFSDGYHVV